MTNKYYINLRIHNAFSYDIQSLHYPNIMNHILTQYKARTFYSLTHLITDMKYEALLLMYDWLTVYLNESNLAQTFKMFIKALL